MKLRNFRIKNNDLSTCLQKCTRKYCLNYSASLSDGRRTNLKKEVHNAAVWREA